METSNPQNPSVQPALTYRQERMATYRRIVRWMWGLYLTGFALVFFLFFWLSYQLPPFEQLENPRSRIASVIYASDGEVLGRFYVENRTPVEYDSISPYVIQALIATEDARFHNHSGIDPWALGRVLFKTLFLGKEGSGGGSTISQQLAKLLVGRPDTKSGGLVRYWRIFTTKLKEWLTAVKLERAYTKEEILTLYLNEFDFLYGACGIRSAAETYFDKHPKDLNMEEAAMLVRMLKNPSLYNPRRSMDNAVKGREQVLKNMQIAGHINQAQYDEMRVRPIDISRFRLKDHTDGIATYFREYLREYLKNLLQDKDKLLKVKPDGKNWDIYRDGLKIYTTIDSRMQQHAEQAVWDHLSEHQKRMFEHWPNWNGKSTKDTDKDPWTYRQGAGEQEMVLRRFQLERQIWQCDRYKEAREQYMPTAVALKLRDSDIFRMRQVEEADKKYPPSSKPSGSSKKIWNGQALIDDWINNKYISPTDGQRYRQIIAGSDWPKIKNEYEAILAYMSKPVQMTVFSYSKRGERDTLMSPIDSIRYHRMHLQTGMMAMDPFTGAIRAWVGGPGYKYFKFDHVNKSNARQVGSTIKPFVYSLVIDRRGYSPCSRVCDQEVTIEKGFGEFGLQKDWTPRNAGGGYSGACMTMVEALRKSLNSVSARFMKDLNSTAPLRNYLHEVGIDTSKVPNSPTICLGSADLSVFEMTGGYAAFANGGYYNEPIFIERIEDRNGNPIYEPNPEFQRVLPRKVAVAMAELLRGTQSGAGGFNGIKSLYGGKTGTTNYQADGWFMGITPHTVVGTWVGCDDRFIRFRSLAYGQGAKMARPIFQNFLRLIEADKELGVNVAQTFPELTPEELQTSGIELNCLRFAKFDGKGDELFDFTGEDNYNIWDYDDDPRKKDKGNSSGITLPPDTE